MRICWWLTGPAALCLAADPTVAAVVAQQGQGLVVLTGEFGTLGVKRKLDIVQRLQQLCGTEGQSCDVFCSETSFGRYRLGRRPICRVTYRCPGGVTKATEAAREEPILLRCPDDEAVPQPAVEQLQPPPYVPPLKQ